jgi:hypothetical protein
MINRVLLTALAAAIFLAVAGYALRSVNERGFTLAEAARDACYGHYGIHLGATDDIPQEVRNHCTRSIRDYRNGWLWRLIFAAGIGATGAFLVVGGILILLRRHRSGP